MPTLSEADGGKIKPAGFHHGFTKEQVSEMIKCTHDPIYFIENYVYIEHPTKGSIKFKLFEFQKNLIKVYQGHNRTISLLSRQSGKALSLDTPIPTPTGWSTMGEISEGDYVIGDDGKPTRVVFATSPMYNHDVYEIEFDNGEIIKADAEHLWKIQSNAYNRRKDAILTTEQIIPVLEKAKKIKQSVRIPISTPFDGEDIDLPIHPYVMGVWLGDGDSHGERYTSNTADIIEFQENIIKEGYEVSPISVDKRRETTVYQTVYNIRPILRDLGILKNKRIPSMYLRASVRQRLELLQGLMDTDGSVDKNGSCEFYNKNNSIIQSVFELLSSLGIKPRIRCKIIEGETYYIIPFTTTKFPVFKLKRKALRQEQCFDHPINSHFYIKDIRKTNSVPVRCIRVDNDSNMFLCGRSMIPTHNTATAAAFILWWAIFKDNQQILIASKDQDGAKEIMDRLWFAYEELPWWIKPGVKTDQVHTKKFDNNSRIRATATTRTSGRGKSNSLVYLDEFAFVRPGIADDFWTAIYPTLSCLVGDTLVLTDEGYKTIDSFHHNKAIGDYFEIENVNVWGKHGIEPVSHGYVSPESETKIIETRRGFTVEATLKHPLYVASSSGGSMKETKNITIDDYLRIDYGMEQYGNIDLSEEVAYMLGGYTAEGWMAGNKERKQIVWIANTDHEFRKVFLESKFIKNFSEDTSLPWKLRCCSYEMVDRFIELGIDPHAKAHQKEVPFSVLQGTKKTICSYLRGLFDGDGSCSNRGVCVSSTSRKLLQQVQLLMANMGIVTNLYKQGKQKPRVIAGNDKTTLLYKESWSLYVPLSQTRKYLDTIGFSIDRKRFKAERICLKREQNDYKLFNVPVDPIKDTILDIISKTDKGTHWFRHQGVRLDKILDGKTARTFTQDKLEKLKILLEQMFPNVYKEYETFFEEYLSKCIWDRVSTITSSANKTYDFTVPGTHTFLQNGIIGSNTGGACIITSTPNTDEDKFASIWFNANMSNLSDTWVDVMADRMKVAQEETEEDYETIFEDDRLREQFDADFLLDDEDDETMAGFTGFHAHWTRVPDDTTKTGYRDDSYKRRTLREGLTMEEWMREYECVQHQTSIKIKHLDGTIEELQIGELYARLSSQ